MFLSTVFKSFKPVFRSQTAIISSFSTKHQEGGAKPWKERDSAHEKDFFNKEDGNIIVKNIEIPLIYRKGYEKIA